MPKVMAEDKLAKREVDTFILEEIDSVPHLEALLLLWNTRPRGWSPEEMAKALYVSTDRARTILRDLKRRDLAAVGSGPDRFSFDSSSGNDKLIEEVDRIYRRNLVRISTMIHSKAPAAVREFARAFKLKKD
jgi:hypothetical protein